MEREVGKSKSKTSAQLPLDQGTGGGWMWSCPTSGGTAVRASPLILILGCCLLSIFSRVARGRASSGRVVLCRLLSIREQSKSEDSGVGCRVPVRAGWRLLRFITAKARCLWNSPPPLQGKAARKRESEERMGMPRGLSAYMVDMVWAVLAGWVSACLLVANEIARGMRAGEIGPFVVG
ncbi:uncharacterized protein LOC119325738 isoform X2 [Triticum dicoccoides]|uniref:uncharacterized protein LOC119325738 isoform X2 n=1 Tax=Triticum dicoccoides TaxID=85692 RepID=UPI001891B6C0|nr:uncharacterized protein LOC119325738 isoform X2 [Triticum dicoccoides]